MKTCKIASLMILEIKINNFDTFTDLIQNKFIPENIETFSEISPQKTLFVKVHLKQY